MLRRSPLSRHCAVSKASSPRSKLRTLWPGSSDRLDSGHLPIPSWSGSAAAAITTWLTWLICSEVSSDGRDSLDPPSSGVTGLGAGHCHEQGTPCLSDVPAEQSHPPASHSERTGSSQTSLGGYGRAGAQGGGNRVD